MTDRSSMESIVARVVTESLETHSAQLRSDIVRRVMEEIAAQPQPEPAAPSGANSAELARAVAEIQLGTSQKEILKALLDNSARFASRAALFVVKGGIATGWQGRGFRNEAVKDFALDGNTPAVARAIGDRVVVSAPASDLDARFVQEFGAPASGEARFLPLVLKDKVAALVYADAGSDGVGQLDTGSLELLVLSTGAWLEITSLRKQAQRDSVPERAESHPAPVAEAAPSFNDPFAGHAPSHARAAAASAEAAAPAAMTAVAEPVAVEELTPAATASAPAPPSGMTAEDQEIHRKAQRFARLLVDEVKLYNQAKVAEGRKHKDLYDRLKEAIEKSRSTYQKRYGNTVAASGNYFQHEVVRSLAEDDLTLMGANFQR